MEKARRGIATGAAAILAAVGVCCVAGAAAKGVANSTRQDRASSVTTNENGCVSRTFTECTVTTNGNMVTEHRRETRTNTDTAGNVLETSTSEYAQSYPVGDTGFAPIATGVGKDEAAAPVKTDSFLGLRFGEPYAAKGATFAPDPDEPTLVRTTFTPAKKLAGFDTYYVCVTPERHLVAKVFACAKETVDAGADGYGNRHYLLKALEKRYRTWARLRSFWRPWYAFDLGNDRYVEARLAGATDDFQTVVAAWDDTVRAKGVEEAENRRRAAVREANERRGRLADEAAEAF